MNLTEQKLKYLKSFKTGFEEDSQKHPNKISILVWVSGMSGRWLKYSFRTWEGFEKKFPFNDIDKMYSVDFQIWVDDD